MTSPLSVAQRRAIVRDKRTHKETAKDYGVHPSTIAVIRRKAGVNRRGWGKHGHAVHGKLTPAYKRWLAMRRRCNDPKSIGYKYYGGRGIKICKRWDKFENFLSDMGPPPPGKVLDRKNNDKDYTPSNCEWVSLSRSNSNKRRWGKHPASIKRHIKRALRNV